MDKPRTAPTVNYQAPAPKPKDETGQRLPTDQLNVTYPAPGANNITIPFVASGTVNTMPDGGTVTLSLTIGTQPPTTITAQDVPVTGTDVLSWSYDFTDSPPAGNQFTALPPPNTPMTLVITATIGGVPSQTVISFTYVPPAGLVLDTVAGMSNQSEVTITGTATNATSVSVNVDGGSTDITGKFYYTNTYADGVYSIPIVAANNLPGDTGVTQYAVFAVDTTPPVVATDPAPVYDATNNVLTGTVTDAISGVKSMTAQLSGTTPCPVTIQPVPLPTPVTALGTGPTPVPVPVTNGGIWKFTVELPTLSSGSYFVFLYATDNAGNVSAASPATFEIPSA